MPKNQQNRRRKSHAARDRARAVKATSGASYASAQSGAVHHHQGPKIDPVDGSGFGVDRQADMRTASALIGACAQACRACQASLADKVLSGDRLVIASLFGVVYAVLPSPGLVASPTTQRLFPLAQQSVRSGDGREVLAAVEELAPEELEELLEDTLDVWAALAVEGSRAGEEPAADRDEPSPPDGEQTGGTEEPRRITTAVGTAYLMSAGADQLLSEQELLGLPRHAEDSAGTDPIVCFLCDQPIDVLAEPEVHFGLGLRPLSVDGRVLNTVMPVWTHPGCGRCRIWSWPELMGERQRRGLFVASEDRQPDRAPRQGPRDADYTYFTLARKPRGGGSMIPVVVIQPGEQHEYGTEGHLAAYLSDGLKTVDLSGGEDFPELAGWQVRCDRGRMVSVTRVGGGAWYRQEGGYETPGKWRQAARTERKALVLVVPAGSIGDREGDGWLAALDRATRAGHVLGGLAAVRGTLS